MPPPFIAITAGRVPRFGHPATAVMDAYSQALAQAGAVPIIIPCGLSVDSLQQITAHVDGILFTGGGDIHPRFYHGSDHSKLDSVDEERDQNELDIFQETLRLGLPFLAICRGIQLVNVALGGTLYADIADQRPGAQKHDYFPDYPRDLLAHTVQIEPASILARTLGQLTPQVNSLHHQGLRDLAPALRPLAYAPDGLVEAVELPGHPFGLGVQWHPEWLQEHAAMRALFHSFVSSSHGQ